MIRTHLRRVVFQSAQAPEGSTGIMRLKPVPYCFVSNNSDNVFETTIICSPHSLLLPLIEPD